MRRPLPIGIDDFEKVRSEGYYYVDKSLMIQDFVEMRDEVALIARPRRFGKTLNMRMLQTFFDITKNSKPLFEGLEIMNTPYAGMINSRPVIFLTLKDCKATSEADLCPVLNMELYREYLRYEKQIRGHWAEDSYEYRDFYGMIETLRDPASSLVRLTPAIRMLTEAARDFYQISPVLLIDEYDQPIMSSYEYGYHDQVEPFFSGFFGQAMKGHSSLGQALITGVQRVAKESIFSQFNNPQVYTVTDPQYARYFGLDEGETAHLLQDYGLNLNDDVRQMYDGYRIGGIDMYNPWSILNYAKRGQLENYWVKTSANFLVRDAMSKADCNFWDRFDRLAAGEDTEVWLTLDTSYAERDSNHALWGLLVNAGYLTVVQQETPESAVVRIPNGEILAEFRNLVAEMAGIEGIDLKQMFNALMRRDFNRFFSLYQSVVISCTSYMDAKENAYHMLFLGMCISLRGAYRVSSNLETGHGRSDITLESLRPEYPNIIVEFKQGPDINTLKDEALRQILDNQYYASLSGETICVGLAHDKKHCAMLQTTVTP